MGQVDDAPGPAVGRRSQGAREDAEAEGADAASSVAAVFEYREVMRRLAVGGADADHFAFAIVEDEDLIGFPEQLPRDAAELDVAPAVHRHLRRMPASQFLARFTLFPLLFHSFCLATEITESTEIREIPIFLFFP